jgi:GDP-L-fucose synthase
MYNILITGGSGLLGSEINIEKSHKPTSKQLDLLDYNQLRRFIIDNRIKKIIHCAAFVGGVEANKNKLYDFFAHNMQMNMNVLRACQEFNLQDNIFILSTCVFPAHGYPYTEEALHSGEPHPTNYGYAYAKRMLEVGARSLRDQYGIRSTCLIPCNLYGINDNYDLENGHVIPSLIHKCYNAKNNYTDMVVWGNGNPEREFMYANDMARVIEQVNSYNGKLPSKMIVSPGIQHSIKDVVSIIARKMKFNGNIKYDESMPNGILRKPSINQVFQNYFPEFKFTDIEQGLNDTINAFVGKYPNVRL